MASDSDSVPEPMSGIARERLGRWRYPPRLEPVTIREIVYLRQAPNPHFSQKGLETSCLRCYFFGCKALREEAEAA